jgi:hypothetical protein
MINSWPPSRIRIRIRGRAAPSPTNADTVQWPTLSERQPQAAREEGDPHAVMLLEPHPPSISRSPVSILPQCQTRP